jgi:hypothetical protein
VYSIDCEFEDYEASYPEKKRVHSKALIKLTIVDQKGQVVFDTLTRPRGFKHLRDFS